jgi:hypothetical protein
MTDQLVAERLLAKSEAELYAELGTLLLGHGQGFGLEDLARARRFAEDWMRDHADELQKKVCKAKSVKKLIEEEGVGQTASVLALTEILISPRRPDAIATIVAVIIVRRGLRKYCADE